ncbi:MAG: lipopolysaccharide biosynthesis protein [Chitinophagaceae bacterium]|nr:MAG: lipopolysaccharide biosynthesis protein [Chitinophagaceae bacterium]
MISPETTGDKSLHKTARYADEWFDHFNPESGLKDKSIKGGLSTTLSQVIVFVVNTLSTMILARILLPADFGLVAMVAAFAGFVSIFKDMGFSMAIIQKPKVTHDQVSILFWFNIFLCLFISLIFVGLAPLIDSFYHEPRLFYIIVAYAVSIFISSLSVQHNAILSRKMEFNKIALSNIFSGILSVIVAVIMAYTGFGYWSLVYLTVSQSLFATLLLWYYCPWKPKLLFWQEGIQSFLHFGAGISGFNIINYFSRNMDNVIIGKYLGSTMLGFYSKAYQLMMLPLTKLRDPIITVGTPALSSLLNDPERYRRYYHRLVFIICFFSFPMTVFLAVFAKELILVVLGSQWIESVLIFQLLSISALIQPITGTTGVILISTGHAGRYFKIGIVSSLVIIASFIIGIRWGVKGVVIAYAVANYSLVVPVLLYCFHNTPIKFWLFIKEISLPVLHTALMGILLWGGKVFLSYYLPPLPVLFIAFLIAVSFYYFTWHLYRKGKAKIMDINELAVICYNKIKYFLN